MIDIHSSDYAATKALEQALRRAGYKAERTLIIRTDAPENVARKLAAESLEVAASAELEAAPTIEQDY
jgi:hypothetical protein